MNIGPDIIDHLAGIEAGSRLDRLRGERPLTRENAQASYRALFEPTDPGRPTLKERFAVAAFVAGLHGAAPALAFYGLQLRETALDDTLPAAVGIATDAGRSQGPGGRYPAGPLSIENTEGNVFQVPEVVQAALGPRLSAAFEHAHLLVYRPRDAAAASLQKLLDAGFSTTEIVTLSQIVAFLSFQLRVVAGLKALAAVPAPAPAA
ncbi:MULTISPECIES: CMD domain protein [Chelatococcus]|uniref:CMD domain protein n=1 Tax=Chelatococcus caeni TaxID=1348468 RepID=A0A840BSF2_9HYPH|nr:MULTISPECIES: CMD domain protein [Chelatococcus]ALA18595.1 hypothetical protein AL346_15755 [Chelatococcus sp. CO-6]MBB4015724.1 CMD domain protein [Chelatococcus caeni]